MINAIGGSTIHYYGNRLALRAVGLPIRTEVLRRYRPDAWPICPM